ncbi:MAG: hypothetical protein AAFQ87_18765 [Bacteroidota bacterium]
MDFEYELQIIGRNESAVRFKISSGDLNLSFHEVFSLWQRDDGFVQFYIRSLFEFDFDEIYWEHPGVTEALLSKEYECIVQKTNSFGRRIVNEKAFEKYIISDRLIEVFPNLGRNAQLVVPTRKSEPENYKHFAVFLQSAPLAQRTELFKKIGEVVLAELKNKEMIWLNTAGMGVIWLHIRNDTTPKYYKTKTYRNPEFLK